MSYRLEMSEFHNRRLISSHRTLRAAVHAAAVAARGTDCSCGCYRIIDAGTGCPVADEKIDATWQDGAGNTQMSDKELREWILTKNPSLVDIAISLGCASVAETRERCNHVLVSMLEPLPPLTPRAS